MKIPEASQGRRTPEIVRALSDGLDTAMDEAVTQPPVDDDELLDGYSRTVSGVVERIKLAVVNIRVRHGGCERRPTPERSPELKSLRLPLWNSNFWNRQH